MLRSRIPILISLDHIRPKDPGLSLGVASIISHLKSKRIEYNAHIYNMRRRDEGVPVSPKYPRLDLGPVQRFKIRSHVWRICVERAISQINTSRG